MKVKIYGRAVGCPYCTTAKQICEQNKFDMEFIDMEAVGMTRDELSEIVGKPVSTVPQIFVEGEYIGGCTEFIKHLTTLAEKKNDTDNQ
ncbi:thioridoxin [Salmonella phage SE_PL]|uniref:GrxA family glutaredoxin n=1 Tax=Salmonella enterica TaxID=28901 RepID=UPI000FDF9743|nr:thioredoxin [Salmonella phage Munch]ECV9084142.1 GrxA family glutaredoxin [Salmonella enterica subsp. enterica serovar Infantis]QCW18909.1 glutaredoxin [Salmonella phage 7t3]QIG62818.1 thioridoxin [Salmonella phage SE_PL]